MAEALEHSSESKIREQFAAHALECHNEYRQKHGVPKLKLNQKLCEYAQEWADKCAKISQMTHRDSCRYGENIYYFWTSDPNHQKPKPQDVVRSWYDEIKNHTFGDETINPNTLHFSQVIWKASTDIGIGMAGNKEGEYYVVANYDPKGNLAGQFVENV